MIVDLRHNERQLDVYIAIISIGILYNTKAYNS